MSDLDELVTTERFREIHEARQQVIEDERTLNEALATGRIDDRRARRLFQRSVDTFVRELECLLNPPQDDPSAYWTEEPIGEIQLPDGRMVPIDGLGQYLGLDEQIVIEVKTETQGRYFEVAQEDTEERAVQPSWELLRGAFRVANAALTDLGMELDTGDEQDAIIKYEHLVPNSDSSEAAPDTNGHEEPEEKASVHN
jgi:hypothetical protein